MRPAGNVGPYLWDSRIAMATVGTVVPRCPRIVGEMRFVTGSAKRRAARRGRRALPLDFHCIAMAKVGSVVPRCPRIVGERGIVTDRPAPCGPNNPLRPAGDVGPYLWVSNCIAMAEVGTVVPRCPQIVGEVGIGTDRPTPCGPPGTSGPTLGTPLVVTDSRSEPSGFGLFEVGLHHDFAEFGAFCFWFPAEHGFRFGRVAEQLFDFGRAEVVGAHFHQHLAGRAVDSLLVHAFAFKNQVDPEVRKGPKGEVAHGVHLVGGEHEVIRLVLLENPPHAFSVFRRIPPVALGTKVAEDQFLLQSQLNPGRRPRDLARDKGFSPAGRLVIEQDAVAGVDPVRFPVVHDNPVAVELGHRIGRARIKGRLFRLRNLLHLAIQLAGRSLVKARFVLQTHLLDRVEKAQRPDRIDFRRILRHVERYLHVALRAEVIDFVRCRPLEQAVQVGGIRQVSMMEKQPLSIDLRVIEEVVDSPRVEATRAPDHAMYGITLFEQLFSEVRAVLARDSGNECYFRHGNKMMR